MGLMDDIKKAQEMAQQAQQQAGGMPAAQMPDAQDMQYAQLAQKIATGGLPGVATIKSIGETGETDAGVSKQYAIDVSIELEAGGKYDTTVSQNLTDDAINSGHYAPGKRFEVKVDPDDKSQALLYGLAD
jgi:outer membrane PBP1 activator LpoA protein